MAIKIRKKQAKRLLLIGDALLIVILCVSLFFLARTLIRYAQNKRLYADVREAALVTPPPATPSIAQTPEPDATPEPVSELPITVDFDYLRTVNKEVVGWIYCGDTPINYPVVLHADNEYYLTRGFDKSRDAGGAIFADCRNGRELAEENVILYGHRMKNDSMFGVLESFASAEYCAAHQAFYFITPAQSYRVEVYATRTVRSDMEYFPVYFFGDEYARYITKAIGESHFASPVEMDAGFRTLTLVTCSRYERFDDPKFLVHGKLVPVY